MGVGIGGLSGRVGRGRDGREDAAGVRQREGVREMSSDTRKVAGKLALARGLADCIDRLHPLARGLLKSRMEEATLLDMRQVDDALPSDHHERLTTVQTAIEDIETDFDKQMRALGNFWVLNTKR